MADRRTATTVILLVKGRFRLELSTGTFLLKEEGDHAMWGPAIDHTWQVEEDSVVIEEDSVVITVRWPSLPCGDASAPSGN